MKKFIASLIAAVLTVSFAACGKSDGGASVTEGTADPSASSSESITENTTVKNDPYSKIPDIMSSSDGRYEIAFVADTGQLLDKSFNQGSWEGVKKYASDNGKSYKYYQPANGSRATDTDRYNAMRLSSG